MARKKTHRNRLATPHTIGLMTDYQRLGGEPAVTALLDGLYSRVEADPLLAPLLQGIDLACVKTHQFAVISMALGGLHPYIGRPLAVAHARLPITSRHFDAFLRHLEDVLREIGASADLMTNVMARVTPLRGVIVNSHAEAAAR